MDISNFSKKPQLLEIAIDDADIVETYGEAVKFCMKDHIDLDTYFDFYRYQKESSSEQLMTTLRKIILKADGTRAIPDDEVLPLDLTLAVLVKVNDNLGKSGTKKSEKETGILQS
jgi:hypothetical protein